MRINLFDVKNGVARITDHCHTIWYLKNIIDKYGEDIATNIFIVFQYMTDINPDTNPFANTNEIEKLELIIRSVAPELDISIDWDDPEITECIELCRKLFETPTYRIYLASKRLQDKFEIELSNVYVSMKKDDANVVEITKGYQMFEIIKDGAKKAFKEFEEENDIVKSRGGNKIDKRNPGGKEQELL